MKQILLLGDSIRMQYQPVVGQKLSDDRKTGPSPGDRDHHTDAARGS